MVFLFVIVSQFFSNIIFYYFSDAVVSQVLDELGLQLTDQLSGLPQAAGSLTVPGAKTPVAASPVSDADADLEARLNNLRREQAARNCDCDCDCLKMSE